MAGFSQYSFSAALLLTILLQISVSNVSGAFYDIKATGGIAGTMPGHLGIGELRTFTFAHFFVPALFYSCLHCDKVYAMRTRPKNASRPLFFELNVHAQLLGKLCPHFT